MCAARTADQAAGLEVALEAVGKSYGGVPAVDAVSAVIPSGAFLALLGPSGSGKTTLLNLIAGFLRPDAGAIRFDGAPVEGVPPHRRGLGMVFQSFALFPHMSVGDNVAFPLRRRGVRDRAEVNRRVTEALAMVRLAGLDARMTQQLSGGQRQRVAMARAIVARPRLLLLDEPLGSLDRALREELQVEIRGLHRRLGSTFVCVTHDQAEAMAMADLVAVMQNGRLLQTAPPEVLWRQPACAFVASFLGGAGLLPGKVLASGPQGVAVRIADGSVLHARPTPVVAGTEVAVVVRPEAISTVVNGHDVNQLSTRLVERVFLGDATKLVLEVAGTTLTARVRPDATSGLTPGQPLTVAADPGELAVVAAP